MRVILAGFNVDCTALDDSDVDPDLLTPETISAAYARVTRDPRSLDELRVVARNDIEKARRSNTSIVFGLGHSSIAEHAVFNFDLIGLSRLAVEEVQSHRLNSYTEKSQRYIKLDRDYVVPVELEKISLSETFRETVHFQFELYEKLYEKLLHYFTKKCPESESKESVKKRVEGLAKEDARYALPMATTAQLGMTLNARSLEYMIRRLAETGMEETRQLGRRLAEEAKSVAPSLVKYTVAQEYQVQTLPDREIPAQSARERSNGAELVRLLDFTPDGDDKVIAAILFARGWSRDDAVKQTSAMNNEEKKNIIRERLRNIKTWDQVPREFELASFTFELIVSGSCFAQLKRHRMATLIRGDYMPDLGTTIPDSVVSMGAENILRDSIKKSEALYRQIKKKVPAVANYALINAHRRTVLMKMNARELYHFSRLREDEHAQWDIRAVARQVLRLSREKMPALFILACGKHEFKGLYDSLYNF